MAWSPEEHCRSMVAPLVVTGNPALSAASRAML